jgi:predicted nucleic acid-binding protein
VIILDTNIVSEPMKPQSSATVTDWLDRQVAETLFFTTISLSELLLGVELMPEGRRRTGLDTAVTNLVARMFGPRVLPFDPAAAASYAKIVGRARSLGYNVPVAAGQIAAIATARGFIVATRGTALFAATGVPVINPWSGDSCQQTGVRS